MLLPLEMFLDYLGFRSMLMLPLLVYMFCMFCKQLNFPSKYLYTSIADLMFINALTSVVRSRGKYCMMHSVKYLQYNPFNPSNDTVSCLADILILVLILYDLIILCLYSPMMTILSLFNSLCVR